MTGRSLGPFSRGILGVALVAGAGAALLFSGSAGSATAAGEPVVVTDPTISGTAVVGSKLTASHGTWNGGPGLTYKYQWLRCDEKGESCTDLAGATTTTYTAVSADLGSTLKVRVTASNNAGSKFETSAPTPVVVKADGTPANSKPPTISGTAVEGSVLSSTTGSWVGTDPITYSYQWTRCDSNGNACGAISNATRAQYTLVAKDVSRTLRIKVTGRNSRGKSTAFSLATDVVKAGSGGGSGGGGGGGSGIIVLPGGQKSVAVADIPKGERLIVDQVTFSPNPVTSRNQSITVHIRIKDTRSYVVRGAYVFLRSTPILTSTPTDAQTATDGTITYSIQPRSDFPLKNGYSVQFFVKAYRQGDPSLAGISGTRLVQVATKAS